MPKITALPEGILPLTSSDLSCYVQSGETVKQVPSGIGAHTIWIPATAMYAQNTDGAKWTEAETSNLIQTKSYVFKSDATEFVQFAVRMPKSWDRLGVQVQIVWSPGTVSSGDSVAWVFSTLSIRDGDDIDQAPGNVIEIVDTCTSDLGVLYISPVSSVLADTNFGGTLGSESYIVFIIGRDHDSTNDDLDAEISLFGVSLYYNTQASTDD